MRAYGLIDGAGDDLRVSEDAIAATKAPQGSSERREALQRLALKPALFQAISKAFPTTPSSDNLVYWLVTQGFSETAAAIAAKSYLDTMRFVGEFKGAEGADNPALGGEDGPMPAQVEAQQQGAASFGGKSSVTADATVFRRAVFNLDEGDVVIQFPKDLSKASVEDLADYLETFMKRARREAKDEPQ